MKSIRDNGQEAAGAVKGQPKLGHGEYLRFRELVLERSGLHFPEKRQIDLEIGLGKAWQSLPATVAEHLGSQDLDSYYHFLKAAAVPAARAEMERFINLLTIGETHFFRDSAQFEALATQVLPELIARKQAEATAAGANPPGVPQLRLWSVGCATGEEPYSLAMLLHRLIPDLKDWRILILATDINQDSLNRARQALYSDWSFREPQAKTQRALYFTSQGKFYRLNDKIRQMVTFAPLNLIEDNFPTLHNNTTSMDLIICRNVTIYFTEETTRCLIHKFYQALVEGGWLVVGHAELSLASYQAFQAYTFPNTVLYQKTGRPRAWPGHWVGLDPAKSNLPAQANLIHCTANMPGPSTPKISLLLNSLLSIRQESPEPKSPAKAQAAPLAPSAATAPNAAVSTGPDPYHRARLLLSEGHADQAITLLEPQLDQLPETLLAEAYCLLARAHANQGRWEQARRWGEEAVAQDILLAEAYYTLALVHEQGDYLDQAITCLKKVIYLNREGPLPYFNLAMLYKKRGETRAALRTLNNIVKILSHWPPEKIIPDSGGTSAARLLNITQQILKEIEK